MHVKGLRIDLEVQIFGPSTWPTSLVMRVSNPKGTILRPISYTNPTPRKWMKELCTKSYFPPKWG